MSTRRAVSTADKGMIGPMKIHIVHERVGGGMWVSGCAVKKRKYAVVMNIAMLFLNCCFQGFHRSVVSVA